MHDSETNPIFTMKYFAYKLITGKKHWITKITKRNFMSTSWEFSTNKKLAIPVSTLDRQQFSSYCFNLGCTACIEERPYANRGPK
jgi:hypothetical protein